MAELKGQFPEGRIAVCVEGPPAGVTVEQRPEERFSEIVTRIEDW